MRSLSTAVLLACCCLLGACGTQGPGAADVAATDESKSQPIDGARPVELRMVDDVLRLGLERPLSYLPSEVSLTDQSAVIIADLLYDGLTEAVGNEDRLRPGLAEAWWPNEDYTEWTFAIDPATGVGADTVVTSLSRFATGANGGSTAGVAARLAAGIQTVAATDRKTVLITLEGPNAGLPWVLSGLPFSIVGQDGAPTGGYRIGSDDAAAMRLTPRAARDVTLRSVLIEWEPNRSRGYQRLLDGKLDGALVPSGLLDRAGGGQERGLGASVSTRFYVLHLGSEVFADPEVRAAVWSALDRDRLVTGTSDLDVVATDGLLPPSMIGYRPGPCLGCGSEISAEVADRLVLPRPIEIAYAEQGQRQSAAEMVAQLTAAGLAATEQEMEPEELATVIVNGGTDIFSFGWVAAATSSDAILPVLLSADSPANVARIGSEEIDQILAAAAVTADDSARWDLHHQAHQAALSSGRLIPVAASRSSLLLADRTKAVVRADGSIDVKHGG